MSHFRNITWYHHSNNFSLLGWIDINLTVTPTTVALLFTLLSDSSLPIRLATCVALTKVVGKGLKEPADKLQLIKVLSLGTVLDALETKTRSEQVVRGSDVDEGEESYREALGRLLNILGLELSKVIEASRRPSTDPLPFYSCIFQLNRRHCLRTSSKKRHNC